MSRELRIDPWEIVTYALLHDVGKPIQRLAKRVVEGHEAIDNKLRDKLRIIYGKDIEDLSRISHDELSKETFNKLIGKALSKEALCHVREILKKVDPLAAAERGYETAYSKCFERLASTNALGKISKNLKVNYNYHTTPILSPLWILHESHYRDYVGPYAVKDGKAGMWKSKTGWDTLRNMFKELFEAIERCDVDKIVEENSKIIGKLLNVKLWFPIKPVTIDNIVALKALDYREAQKLISYGEVVDKLITMLFSLKHVYADKVFRGFVDTLLHILKVTVSFVPSAVFGTILPDISLYSHSKLVTAYAATHALTGADKYRVLVIDANGIQRFIASPIKAAAASRVMRGRSLIIELALDALTHYALQIFGELPEANIIISEGGTLDILVPDVDIDERVKKLTKVANRLSENELNYSLEFTIAYSKAFSIEEGFFLHSLKSGRGFIEVLNSLSENIAYEKARRQARKIKALIDVNNLEDYDTLTGEPISRKSMVQGKALRVNEDILDYVNGIAGSGKVNIGDKISEITHLSLAAGSTARNLVGIIGIYIYEKNDEPYSELVNHLFKKFMERVCRRPIEKILCCNILGEPFRGKLAAIPLPSVGALYLLISLTKVEPYNPEKDSKAAWILIHYVINEIARVIEETYKKSLIENANIMMRIKLTNATTTFIPSKKSAGAIYNKLLDVFNKLLNLNVDLGLGITFTNTYHPAQEARTKENKEISTIRLIDLDEYVLLGLAKLDLDMVGEVKHLLSISPSRLITFSDLLNIVISGKAYFYVLKKSEELLNIGKGYSYDVIVLYAGGDDVTIYGRWNHVINFIYKMYDDIDVSLYPLTSSSAIVIDQCNTPILNLYDNAIELLEARAKPVRASVALSLDSIREIKVNEKYIVIDVIPYTSKSPWPTSDESTAYNLELLSVILEPQMVVTSDHSILHELEEVKRDLYILSRIGYHVQGLVGKAGTVMNAKPIERLNLEIAYSYAWTRRRKAFSKIIEVFQKINVKYKPTLLRFPEDACKKSVAEALRIILAAKPILDLIILALRRPESIKPTMVRSE